MNNIANLFFKYIYSSRVFNIHENEHTTFYNLSISQQRAYQTFSNTPTAITSTTPVENVNPNVPPFLILSASMDLGLQHDAKQFVSELSKYNIWNEYITISQSTHSSIANKLEYNIQGQIITEFDQGIEASKNQLPNKWLLKNIKLHTHQHLPSIFNRYQNQNTRFVKYLFSGN